MKKIFKSWIFSFVLGGIIFGSIGALASQQILSNNVTYNNTYLTTELDKLYTKAEKYKNLSTETNITSDKILSGNSAYNSNGELINGSISTYNASNVTPSASSQTLETNGKYANGNITVSAVPSTYQNLTSTTTVKPEILESGKTAYKNDGTLVTGTLNTSDCIKGTFVCDSNGAGSAGQVISGINFNPTIFKVYGTSKYPCQWYGSYNKNVNSTTWIGYDTANLAIASSGTNHSAVGSISDLVSYSSSKFKIKNLGSDNIGVTLTYIACK